MKKNYVLIAFLCLLFSFNELKAQTIWTGPKKTFTKINNAVWTLEANQDRITNNVWITRANNKGIFNIAKETSYLTQSSPSDTEWAFGKAVDYATLTFDNWESTSGGNPPSLVNQDMVLHLISDNIYIDIKFISWSSGDIGGGFSYERTTNESLSINDVGVNSATKLFPNPTSEFIQISGLTKSENYSIYNIIGVEIKKGYIANNKTINTGNLTNGFYFFRLENGTVIKFIKE